VVKSPADAEVYGHDLGQTGSAAVCGVNETPNSTSQSPSAASASLNTVTSAAELPARSSQATLQMTTRTSVTDTAGSQLLQCAPSCAGDGSRVFSESVVLSDASCLSRTRSAKPDLGDAASGVERLVSSKTPSVSVQCSPSTTANEAITQLNLKSDTVRVYRDMEPDTVQVYRDMEPDTVQVYRGMEPDTVQVYRDMALVTGLSTAWKHLCAWWEEGE